MRNPVLILALAISGLALGLGVWSWMQWTQQNASTRPYLAATRITDPRQLPAFMLTDQNGGKLTPESLRGNWHLLFFGYTHCPDVCPNTLVLLHEVTTAIKQDKNLTPPQVLFISVDPKRDRPKNLAAYVRYFDDGFIGATGNADELKKLTGALYLPFSYTPTGKDNDYTVDHSGVIVLLNPQAQAVAYFSPPLKLDAMLADLRRLLHASS